MYNTQISFLFYFLPAAPRQKEARTSADPSTMPVSGLENQSLNWACEAKTCRCADVKTGGRARQGENSL